MRQGGRVGAKREPKGALWAPRIAPFTGEGAPLSEARRGASPEAANRLLLKIEFARNELVKEIAGPRPELPLLALVKYRFGSRSRQHTMRSEHIRKSPMAWYAAR